MQNQNTKLETLLEHAWSALGQSMDELKSKYKNYSVFVIECIEKEVHEHVVEIRLDNEEATLAISFDSKNKSNTCFLFLDSSVDEELLIDYLVSSIAFFSEQLFIRMTRSIIVPPSFIPKSCHKFLV